jgi:DNA-binding NtrC family response regulator
MTTPTIAIFSFDATEVDVQDCALVVEEGPEAGLELAPLPLRILIGRLPWCDLRLSDGRVSSTHCELTLEAAGIRLRDQESTNGVFVGGVRVYDALLGPGSTFRVGGTRIRFELRAGRRRVRQATDPTGELLGSCPAMRRLFDMIARVAPRDLPVLLLGETGTGKSALAKAIHGASPRRDKPFVAVNCGALPPDLVEATLFGHVKGAFTGALRDSAGVFEQARGGTLFLDEIGEMPLPMQPKLLQALETHTVRPVGAEGVKEVDFRLVSATNRPIQREISAGRFRQDLYFRVAGLELLAPPLRDRADDLPALIQRFLDEDCPGAAARLSAAGLGRLMAHSWPGNVRELQNVLARASMLAGDGPILPEHLLFGGRDDDPSAASAAPSAEDLYAGTFRDFKAALLAHHERRWVELLMARCGGNITRAAREGELSRTYLLTMLRKHGLYEDLGAE